ncbi:MAG: lipopolysaccharide heptosyltransferase I [Hyphomicrobiales bacterium]|nr:lipopolysaccharide heptosyltransferase I [Hyphomicrobiales bacterium]
MSEILIIKTSSLGDVVHQMPAVTELRQHHRNARVAWVVEEAFAPLVRLHPAVDEVLPVASRRWRHTMLTPGTWGEIGRFATILRARRYDRIVDTQGLVRSALIARMAHGERHGFDAKSVRERGATCCYDVRHAVARDLHAVARNRLLTGLALGYAPQGQPEYGLMRDRLRDRVAGGYGLLLHGTARPEKEWSEASWVALGRALAPRGLPLVLLWGSESERARGARIAEVLPNASLIGRQTLDAVARLVAGATFVIGVDTGLLHLAAALAVPLVAIFVASEPSLTGPIGSGRIAVVGGKGTPPSVEAVVGALDRQLR